MGKPAVTRWLAVLLVSMFSPVTPAADLLESFMQLQTGTFDSSAQAAIDRRYRVSTWHIAEVTARADNGIRWVYVESWIAGAEAPYLQRLVRISVDPVDAHVIRNERFQLAQPATYVGAHLDATRLAALGSAETVAMPGCDVLMTRAGAERFEGGTIGSSCSNRYKGAAYAVSSTILTPQGIENWDRGFTSGGHLAWGPAAGGYQLRRRESEVCAPPVRLLVFGTIDDRAAFGAYVSALAQSGLYLENGGVYEAMTPVLSVLEGKPPPGRGVIVARFPCLEAVERLWNDPRYDEIRKLRDGIADFEVLVLPVVPRTQ